MVSYQGKNCLITALFSRTDTLLECKSQFGRDLLAKDRVICSSGKVAHSVRAARHDPLMDQFVVGQQLIEISRDVTAAIVAANLRLHLRPAIRITRKRF